MAQHEQKPIPEVLASHLERKRISIQYIKGSLFPLYRIWPSYFLMLGTSSRIHFDVLNHHFTRQALPWSATSKRWYWVNGKIVPLTEATDPVKSERRLATVPSYYNLIKRLGTFRQVQH